MADFEYDSAPFVNGEDVTADEDVGIKKIKLANIDVSGRVLIAEKKTLPMKLTWEKTVPTIGTLAEDVPFQSMNVILDDDNPPHIAEEGEGADKKYYAVFGVFAEGNVEYNDKDYRAVSHDTIKIRLLIDELKNPTFIGGFEPFFIDPKTAYIKATDKLPEYTFVIKAFSIGAIGTADVSVALVTPKDA